MHPKCLQVVQATSKQGPQQLISEAHRSCMNIYEPKSTTDADIFDIDLELLVVRSPTQSVQVDIRYK